MATNEQLHFGWILLPISTAASSGSYTATTKARKIVEALLLFRTAIAASGRAGHMTTVTRGITQSGRRIALVVKILVVHVHSAPIIRWERFLHLHPTTEIRGYQCIKRNRIWNTTNNQQPAKTRQTIGHCAERALNFVTQTHLKTNETSSIQGVECVAFLCEYFASWQSRIQVLACQEVAKWEEPLSTSITVTSYQVV
jgi:hypothetical protein